MIKRLLVADRGEIARRIFATCRAIGIDTVAVYSDADTHCPHVREADYAVHLPGNAPSATYLRGDLMVAAARKAGADAVHPGYGFLAESADFASAVLDAGLAWIGPEPKVLAVAGDKLAAPRRDLQLEPLVEILEGKRLVHAHSYRADEILMLLRVAGKRQVGQLNMTQLVALLLISNAVQNSMNGGDNSITGGIILTATLVGLHWIVAWLTYHNKTMEGLIEGRPVLLIHNGHIDRRAVRRAWMPWLFLSIAVIIWGMTPVKTALNASPNSATPTSAASIGSPAAPIPIATIDSPMATITTRPWRSTKCAGPISKPSSLISLGVDHSRTKARVHRTYCAVLPAMPPANTRTAETKLSGASVMMDRSVRVDVAQANRPMWTETTAR